MSSRRPIGLIGARPLPKSPLGPLFGAELRDRLKTSAPELFVRYTTRSRPVDLALDLRSGIDMAVDWLRPDGKEFHHRRLFDEWLVAVAQSFVHLRLRQDPEDLLPGMRPWRSVLDREMIRGEGFTVSELLEAFMVTARSNLFGIIPHSMLKLAEEWFRLRAYGWSPRARPVAIDLWWHASRDKDPAHAFIRAELERAVAAVLSFEAPVSPTPLPANSGPPASRRVPR